MKECNSGTWGLFMKCQRLTDPWPLLGLWVVVNHSIWPWWNVSHTTTHMHNTEQKGCIWKLSLLSPLSVLAAFFFFSPSLALFSPPHSGVITRRSSLSSSHLSLDVLKQTLFHLPRLRFSALLLKLACQTTMIPRSPSSRLLAVSHNK